jgi:hypothetical protein
VIMPPSRWQRVAITALLVLPLLLVVLLSAPAWLVLPFLSEPRRKAVIEYLKTLIDWIKEITKIPAEPAAQPFMIKAGHAFEVTGEPPDSEEPPSLKER